MCTFPGFHSPDFNGDLLVTVADLSVWAALQVAGGPAADYNCDGFVDVRDLGLFAVAQANQPPGCP